MSSFVEQLILAEKAAENIYFAKVNRELIESLHKRMQAGEAVPSNVRSSAQTRTDDSAVVKKLGRG